MQTRVPSIVLEHTSILIQTQAHHWMVLPLPFRFFHQRNNHRLVGLWCKRVARDVTTSKQKLDFTRKTNQKTNILRRNIQLCNYRKWNIVENETWSGFVIWKCIIILFECVQLFHHIIDFFFVFGCMWLFAKICNKVCIKKTSAKIVTVQLFVDSNQRFLSTTNSTKTITTHIEFKFQQYHDNILSIVATRNPVGAASMFKTHFINLL